MFNIILTILTFTWKSTDNRAIIISDTFAVNIALPLLSLGILNVLLFKVRYKIKSGLI